MIGPSELKREVEEEVRVVHTASKIYTKFWQKESIKIVCTHFNVYLSVHIVVISHILLLFYKDSCIYIHGCFVIESVFSFSFHLVFP